MTVTKAYSVFDGCRRTAKLVGELGPRSSLLALRAFSAAAPYTMVGRKRLEMLYKLGRRINALTIPGDIVECGTCNGGTAAVLGAAGIIGAPSRRMWLFDSFAGLPEPTAEDGLRAPRYAGKLVASVANVEEVLKRVNVPRRQVKIVPGWFEETFATVEIPQIALLHIDADWYNSVKLALERFYDAVQPGGYVVFDDYGFWEGCQTAVDEFLGKLARPPKLVRIDSRAVYLQKPASH